MNARTLTMLLLLPLAGGCLTSTVEPPVAWNVELARDVLPPRAKARFGVVRLLLVEMRAPYTDRGIAVLRANGSIAFDPCNSYAAAPIQLMKGVALASLEASGLFEAVVTSGSSVDSEIDAEISVRKLALDCRQEGSRLAVAEVSVRLVRNHAIAAEVSGAGVADAADGDYAAAFSKAATEAFADALKRVPDGSL